MKLEKHPTVQRHREKAGGRTEGETVGALDAAHHFSFSGAGAFEATVVIPERTVKVTPGLSGSADLGVTADGAAWLAFIAKEIDLATARDRGQIRLEGNASLLEVFLRCFPS